MTREPPFLTNMPLCLTKIMRQSSAIAETISHHSTQHPVQCQTGGHSISVCRFCFVNLELRLTKAMTQTMTSKCQEVLGTELIHELITQEFS